MKKITFFIPFVIIGLLIISCSKDKGSTEIAVRDFQTQYEDDIDSLEAFFDDHYMTVDANYNVTFGEIPAGGTQQSIRQQYNLVDTTITASDVDYHLYFIKFREGTQKRPTQADSVYVSYRGVGLDGVQFDGAENPVWFKLQDLITGWSHILPCFKTGTYTSTSPSNPPVHDGYGAGVMFLPSGFGYFNSSVGEHLSAYSPLIFSFKLYELKYRDQDSDGILSKDERDLTTETNPLLKWKINPLKYDSDGDGIYNMYDTDDDNDHYTTKYEIKDASGVRYPFDLIPDCSGNQTNPLRIKRHLANCSSN